MLQTWTKKKKEETAHFLDGAHSHTPRESRVKYHQNICLHSVPYTIFCQSKQSVHCLGVCTIFICTAVLRYAVTHADSQPEKLLMTITLLSSATWASKTTEYILVNFF